MLRRSLATLIAGAALLGATAAHAGTHWSIGINLPPADIVVSNGGRYVSRRRSTTRRRRWCTPPRRATSNARSTTPRPGRRAWSTKRATATVAGTAAETTTGIATTTVTTTAGTVATTTATTTARAAGVEVWRSTEQHVGAQHVLRALRDHDTWHEGAVVTEGTKYVLRSDVLFR